MKVSILLLATLISCFGCSGQEASKRITINLTNRSNTAIDSVAFPHNRLVLKDRITKNETKTFEVDVSGVDTKTEGRLPVIVFTGNMKFRAAWGFHDWGDFVKKDEHFYIFDNGINSVDIPLQKPAVLEIIIINKTTNKIDSITSTAITQIKRRETYIELLLNYDKAKQDPRLTIFQNNTPITFSLEHDWQNWNINQEFVYLHQNGIVSKKEVL